MTEEEEQPSLYTRKVMQILGRYRLNLFTYGEAFDKLVEQGLSQELTHGLLNDITARQN